MKVKINMTYDGKKLETSQEKDSPEKLAKWTKDCIRNTVDSIYYGTWPMNFWGLTKKEQDKIREKK